MTPRFPTTLLAGALLMLSGCQASGPAPAAPPLERTGLVTMRARPVTLVGHGVAVGDLAPGFTAVGIDLGERALAEFRGRTVILTTVPSLDTTVCDLQTRNFNEKAGALSRGVVVVTVSMDLPFAQKRWCGLHDAPNVVTLSDSKRREVGERYGLLMKENGLLARAVLVIDPAGVVRYQQIVPEVASEPDYDLALAAAKSAGQGGE